MQWKLFADLFHKLHKMLRVTIGNIETDILYLGHQFQYNLQLLEITSTHPWADRYVLQKHH